MLVPITDLPASVIGFDVSDALTTEDYRDVLLPALQRAAEVGEVRVVIVIPAFDGMTGGAVWQDLKMGVTDVEWMRHGIEWFGWMTPGDVKHFPLDQRAEAISWAAR